MTPRQGPDLPEDDESSAPKDEPAGKTAGRRARPVVLVGSILAVAGLGAWLGAVQVSRVIEDRASSAVTQALHAGDAPWLDVSTSGLQVVLSGTAPDEGARLRVIAAVSDAVGPGRIHDRIEVAQQSTTDAPDFRMELLHNAAGISMIGLVPRQSDPAGLADALRASRDVANVTDLLESADHPAPEGWDAALEFAMSVVAGLPQARLSVAPGQVTITALAESGAARDQLERMLAAATPAGVDLVLDISAPRPVIAPFTLTFMRDGEGARLEACSADTEAAREKILEAARAAGAEGAVECRLGLGAPTPLWADAAVPAIAAIGRLGEGMVTLSNSEITLETPDTLPQGRFHEVISGLREALPEAFHLDAKRIPQMHGPLGFTAMQDDSGRLVLRGSVSDQRMREAVESLARARFERVETMLDINPDVPEGWTLRVIAALDAVAGLEDASAEVTPDTVRLEGVSGDRMAARNAAAILTRRLGAGARYSFAILYDPRLDPVLDLPNGEECAARANDVLALSEIGFNPGGTHFAGDVAPALEQLSIALTDCGNFQLEIGGHTDSQGSTEGNRTLSKKRADAVLDAMDEAGIDTANMTAMGYGSSQPLQDNDTEAGREANRRIEFRLLSDTPVMHDDLDRHVDLITGVTGGPEPQLLSAGLVQAAAEAAAGAGDEAPEATKPHEDAAARGADAGVTAGQAALTAAAAALTSRVDAPGDYGLGGTLSLVPAGLTGAFAGSRGVRQPGLGPVRHPELGFAASDMDGYSDEDEDTGEGGGGSDQEAASQNEG